MMRAELPPELPEELDETEAQPPAQKRQCTRAPDETSTGGEDTGDEASETGETGDGGPCEAIDDRCDSQDVLHSCDLDSGELTELNCASACGIRWRI